ncbi:MULTISPECIES: hypothetical protein [Paenibacillus]|uniref:hypothetical protein n=1 Tax=Paenibacillus TaxID=44249 RepID=UPI00096BD2E9|nr:hypothetical protein [Paenibacillus odorifer]OME21578.1 hypothetical protein BSK57_19725 [Paenibacillus odorifer]
MKQFSTIASLVRNLEDARAANAIIESERLEKQHEHIQSIRKALINVNTEAQGSLHLTGEVLESPDGLLIVFDLKYTKVTILMRELLEKIEGTRQEHTDYRALLLDTVIEKLEQLA